MHPRLTAALLAGATACAAADTGVFYPVDPATTFQHTCEDPAGLPLVIDLDAEGYAPGDTIRVTAVGDFAYVPAGPEEGTGAIAVFSSDGVVDPDRSLEDRVPGAIQSDAPDSPTGAPLRCPGETTEIAEDFLCDGVEVTVPDRGDGRAAFLIVSAYDEFYSDNEDNTEDFGIELASQPDLERGLIASWGFDDGSMLDASGNGNHLHNTGVGSTQGVSGAGVVFTADGQYLQAEDSPSLNPTNALTMAAWYRGASFSGTGNDPIIDKGYVSHNPPYYQYHLGVTGNLYPNSTASFGGSASVGGQTSGTSTGSGFWTQGMWYHIVAIYDGRSHRLFVDGELVDMQLQTGQIDTFGLPLRIGGYTNFNDRSIRGVIDEVRMYRRPLSCAEVILLFEQHAACNPADLVRPFRILDLADVSAFTAGFVAMDPIADLNADGLFDLSDINLFVTSFLAGCP